MRSINQPSQQQPVNSFPLPPPSPGACSPIPSPLHVITPPRIEVMTPPANQLIDLLTAHYPTFEQTQPLQAHVRQAVRMLSMCHTSALGGHVERCPNGHIERVFYNSCGHRFCPRCAARLRRKWLLTRQAKLLPVRHYHVVFTIPHTFNALWRLNPQHLGDLLFHSASGALRALLADPRWLGAEPGMTMTLETWDERLHLHPHLHCLVTGGGLRPTGTWSDVSNPRCLVAVKPLMWEFRKRFCQGLRQAIETDNLTLPTGTTTRQWLNRLKKVNRQSWEVFIAKPPEDGGPTTQDILHYQADDVAGGPLAPDRLIQATALSATQLAYLKSSPLSDTRLTEAPEGQVSFRWGAYNPDTGTRERTQIETLPVEEFLRRYLQHVPPSGYQTIRHYGLYSSAKTPAREQLSVLLTDRQPPVPSDDTDDTLSADCDEWLQEHRCPVCGQALIVIAYIPSSLTGKIIPRLPLGYAVARPPTHGGDHVP